MSINRHSIHLGLLIVMLVIFGDNPEASAQRYTWTTFAGSTGGVGFSDGPIGTASFKNPIAVAADASGNLYLADTANHTIRKTSPGGVVSTLAGKGGVNGISDGSANLARFNRPGGMELDAGGNLFVADTGNHAIRKIDPADLVTTLAGLAGASGHVDGIGAAARFSSPTAITLAPDGNLFVADAANHLIRKITPDGTVSTFAGQAGLAGAIDGGPGVARFSSPRALAADDAGALYIADSDNCLIRKITADGGVATLAGLAGSYNHVDGIASEAKFYQPEGIVVDAAHNVYVADPADGTIRRIAASDGMVTTLVTTLVGDINASEVGRIDGVGTAALFNEPRGLALAPDGSLLVADSGNHAIRRVTLAGTVTTHAVTPRAEGGAVDAVGADARFRSPFGLATNPGGTLYISQIPATARSA